MKYILYYSNFCNHCKILLMELAKSKIKNEINFLCIDRRIKQNGKVMIILENGSQLPLPSNVVEVPSLLMLNHGNNVLTGENIYSFLEPRNKEIQKEATLNNMEPLAFSVTEMHGMSDNYSYLDMSSDEMAAKGTGGTRIMHNFSGLNANQAIETPPEDYDPQKVKAVNLDKLQEQRMNEVPKPIQRN